MSKENPEVGDVWENEVDLKFHIFGKIGSYFSALIFNKRRNSINITCQRFDFCQYKYLGKSKANITDLFEVKDD